MVEQPRHALRRCPLLYYRRPIVSGIICHMLTQLSSPLTPLLRQQGFVLLDGGLATELEARGHDLRDALWSARLLRDDPAGIQQLHTDYLAAGADCIITASYQATIPGFVQYGLPEAEAVALLERAVRLGQAARDAFWADEGHRPGRGRPLVAASIGPYGAYLADGAEYRGDYALDEAGLVDFHRRRWHILAGCRPDLLACETIPSAAEARALCRLLPETPQLSAWFSFSCRDRGHISDGTPLAEAVQPLLGVPQVAAIGINCTAPGHIPALIAALAPLTDKPIVVYPNSGEGYDAARQCWTGLASPVDFGLACRDWYAAGARLIGGCCRTRPGHIRQMRQALLG